jgi:hypothetical protein
MSTGPEPTDGVATTRCQVCETDVPAGTFCGLCGTHLTPQRGSGPHWLRIREYGAAPGEHLLRPSLASSLFPHLPKRSRTPFRVGLAVVLLALVAFALLRLPAALIAVAALGLLLLFVIYLRESGAYRDLPARTLLLTAGLGVGLGVGWVLVTGAAVARSYGVALGAGIVGYRMLRDGIGIPVGGVLLMLAPAVVVRLLRPATRESLDGFMIGALGALTFTAAATLTRLAPQFATGMVARNRTITGLVVEAGIRGVAVPLIAAAVGGLIGAALWFTRPANKSQQHPGYVRVALVLAAVAVLVVYAGLGLIDVARLPQILQLGLYLAVTAVALLVLRIGLHLALLHEEHDEINADEQLLCPHCSHVVPDMAFCPACGVATRASSRSSRTARRLTPPVRNDTTAEGPTATESRSSPSVFPGYAVPAGTYTAAPVRRTSHKRLLWTWGIGIALVAATLIGVSALVTKPPARYACPPDCGRPPMGQPVATNPRFTAPGGEFSVSYPAAGSLYKITTTANGVTADFVGGDGGTLQLFSQPAGNRTPQQIATALVKQTFPDTRTAYEIPNAMVGYQPGYGEAADCWPQGSNSSYMRMRVLVMVAVKNDLALIAAAVGPYRQFGPDFGSGKPSGANLQLALDMGKYVNSFSWRGDPPR